MNTAPIRVMLVDDQELIRTGFRLVLMADPAISVVAEAGNGEGALGELRRLEGACDVVLMDVRMPGMNGIDATRALAAEFPGTRVLVLTTFDLDEYAVAAVQAGASGFLLKDARPSELTDAIRRVVAGDAVMAPSVTQRMLSQLRETGHVRLDSAAPGATLVTRDGVVGTGVQAARAAEAQQARQALELLTERELDVLKLIAEGLNNAEISAGLFLSESTVKTHVGRVLAKLELRDRVHAVIFARTAGL